MLSAYPVASSRASLLATGARLVAFTVICTVAALLSREPSLAS